MAYTKNTWIDQDVERPKTYEVTNNQDGSITLTDSFGLVQELGTPVNAVNMNHIEDGIDGCAIRKHNLTETFNLGEWVLGGTGDDEGIYKSLIANNVGNAISDGTKWEKVELGGGSGYEVGDVILRLTPTRDSGKHLLDGTLLPYGSYKEFIDYIADLYAENPTANYFTTESAWQSSVSTYGSCGKFVYDSTNNTVRLPKVSDILQGTTDLNALGDLVEAGLPNITGWAYNTSFGADADGALYSDSVSGGFAWGGVGTSEYNMHLNIDASRSSSLYKNNFNKVQPQTIKGFVYIVIANSTKTDIQVNIDEIATDLNGKVDKSDLHEVQCVVETYQNGRSWYRVYSDGWCEQGGFQSAPSTDTTYTITLLKPYKDTNYFVYRGAEAQKADGAIHYMIGIVNNSKATNSFQVLSSNTTYYSGFWWKTEGYIGV